MLHEKVGKHGTRNGGRYQVAQSWLNRLYITYLPIKGGAKNGGLLGSSAILCLFRFF